MPDIGAHCEPGETSAYSWPHILGKLYGIGCINYGTSGISNRGILSKVIDTNDSLTDQDAVVILWTYQNRSQWIYDYGYGNVNVWDFDNWGENTAQFNVAKYILLSGKIDHVSDQLYAVIAANEILKSKGVSVVNCFMEPLVDADKLVRCYNLESMPDIAARFTRAADGSHPGDGAHALFGLLLSEYIGALC